MLLRLVKPENKYKRDNEKVLAKAVEKSCATLTEIFKTKTARAPGSGFSRIGVAQNHDLVIFSDHHMTYRGHRHDYFHQFNYPLYCEVLRYYAEKGFALVENGDMEELVIFEPTPEETQRRRKLVKKSFLSDIGELNWDELVGLRIETSCRQLEKILDDNHEYYELVKALGKSRFYKIAGNHDTYYAAELEQMIEAELWPGVVKDVLLVERQRDDKSALDFVITHGHQFDPACVPPHAKKVGEVISECLSWAFQGADRIWRVSDTHKWNSSPVKEFRNILRDSKIIMCPKRLVVDRRCPQTTFLSVVAAGAELRSSPSPPWSASHPSDTWWSPVLQPEGSRSMAWNG